jgi:hypothetical protein
MKKRFEWKQVDSNRFIPTYGKAREIIISSRVLAEFVLIPDTVVCPMKG